MSDSRLRAFARQNMRLNDLRDHLCAESDDIRAERERIRRRRAGQEEGSPAWRLLDALFDLYSEDLAFLSARVSDVQGAIFAGLAAAIQEDELVVESTGWHSDGCGCEDCVDDALHDWDVVSDAMDARGSFL